MKQKNIKMKSGRNKQTFDSILKSMKQVRLSNEEKSFIKNNIVAFMDRDESETRTLVCPWNFEQSHVVQLYRDKDFLYRAVACWVGQSLHAEGGAILISSTENIELMREELSKYGIPVAEHEASGRLCIVEAESLMSWFVLENVPEEETFLHLMRALIRRVRRACGNPKAEVRAWGEIVNIFLKAGNLQAAKRIDYILNDAIDEENFRRLCSYHIDNLKSETHDLLPHLCEGHLQLLPEEDEVKFEKALAAAMIEIFGKEEYARMWKRFAKSSPLNIQMPHSEAVLLGLRAENPELAEKVLARVRVSLAV